MYPTGPAMPAPTRPPGLDVAALRHPTESSRFALACVASAAVVAIAVAVLLASGLAGVLAIILVTVALVILLIRLTLTLWRISLLADAVKVTAATLPEIHAVVTEVRERLGYDRRLDVYVVDRINRVLTGAGSPVAMTSFFGARVIVIEGEAIGDLSVARGRQQLVFLLATFVGALKARHAQWTPVLVALQASGVAKLAWPFIYPWYRATVYTGDRIAYACCGDLDVSLQAAYRVLVGKEIAPHLRAGGLVEQALAVRRSRVLRLSQLVRQAPHATNRYLELLSVAAVHQPAEFAGFQSTVGPVATEVSAVATRLGSRRRSTAAIPLGLVISALLLTAGIAVGLAADDSSTARSIYDVFDPDADQTVAPSDTPLTPVTTPVETPTPDLATALTALVPAELRSSCAETQPGGNASGAVAGVECTVTESSAPNTVYYYAFADADSLQTAFEAWAGTIDQGDCSEEPRAKNTWSSNGVQVGSLACFTTKGDDHAFLWTHDAQGVLVLALDPDLPPSDFYAWWQKHAQLAS
jgi:hypothetical protein